MKRVFGHDVLRCHHCGRPRQVIARITQAGVIRRIRLHLGLPADPPGLAPARSSPQRRIALFGGLEPSPHHRGLGRNSARHGHAPQRSDGTRRSAPAAGGVGLRARP